MHLKYAQPQHKLWALGRLETGRQATEIEIVWLCRFRCRFPKKKKNKKNWGRHGFIEIGLSSQVVRRRLPGKDDPMIASSGAS